MIITPNINNLPFMIQNGIKYFELIAEPVEQEILPGLFIKGWGYNGSIPGPTIQVKSGDYVNIRVINYLPEPTSVHWHGLDVPNNMDGVPDVEPSPKIRPGEYFDYQFRITNPQEHICTTPMLILQCSK
ncbi:multicopper oxidase domain-containing protein [Aminipila terrae]|uniref:multicopper oxidase domain-containing protein n=1 Tax=Aminipila terrae TaxID=2697030 RepID=UPI001FAE0D94|nr:multicopper oxidase domain-containing protein [Aminipila terrae]